MRWIPRIALVVIALAIPFVIGCENKSSSGGNMMTKDKMTMDTMAKDKMTMDKMGTDKMTMDKDKMSK
jgi:hypothetical protein